MLICYTLLKKDFFFCMFCIQPNIIPAALENFLDLDLGN